VTKQFVLPAALLLALGATTALSAPTFAQAPAATAPTATAPAPALGPAPWDQQHGTQQPGTQHRPMMQGQQHQHHRFDFTARAEARIAYVKAELKITPAQETAFDTYAQAIRDNATSMQKSFQDMRGQHGQHAQNVSAIDRVEQRAKLAQMHDQQEQQYLAAFRPLYASLNPDQKKVADDLATPHFGRHFDHGAPRRG
jgi:periplasmic protein CpxP/Spy